MFVVPRRPRRAPTELRDVAFPAMRSVAGFAVFALLAAAALVSAKQDTTSKHILFGRQDTTAAAGAALGGGGGSPTTQVSMESIDGYTPPPSSSTPTPTNFKSGTILSKSQISGYDAALEATNTAALGAAPTLLLTLALVSVAGTVLL
ncbi:hypothetical protein GLX27_002105 [Malassezia furfur]|uniref:Uncharacterized protein n=1 Tax=Malassezia furfur TaxID=55194 RepID=A0ABY8ER66_MALFU|nr:hypothetical protein CBS14141_000010 [Malassezia furfur]WFD47454.1 hypothetical protein GLX27_002105 [Malassezia furfur]